MKTSYTKKLSEIDLAVLDLIQLSNNYGPGYMITRINVPKKFRGQGHGSELLKQVIADATKEEMILRLEVSPSDGLSFKELVSWYRRYGFYQDKTKSSMTRQPEII